MYIPMKRLIIQKSEINPDSWYQHRLNCFSKILTQKVNKNTMVDIGGGNGLTAKHLMQLGMEVLVIEPSVDGANSCIENKVSEIICGSWSNLVPYPNSIPNISAFDVVEHIEDDNLMFQQFYEALQPNGYLFLSVPAYQFLWSEIDVKIGHFRRYTTTNLVAKLKKAGFRISYTTYLFSFLVLPVFIIRKMLKPIMSKNYINKNKTKFKKSQHLTKKSGSVNFVRNTVNKLTKWEYNKIVQSKKTPFGTSCIVVAQKLV